MKEINKIFHGVRGRFLKYCLGLLALAMIILCVIVAIGSGQSLTEATIRNYCQINEQMMDNFSSAYSVIDDATKNFIFEQSVQNSLENIELTSDEKTAIDMYLTYMDKSNIEYVAYIDNKGNIYGLPLINTNWTEYEKNKIWECLGEEYSKLKIFALEDTIFGNGEKRIFAARKVRNMEHYKEPGFILYVLKDSLFESVVKVNADANEINIGILDDGNTMLYTNRTPKLSNESTERIKEIAAINVGQSTIFVDEGCVIFSRDSVSGFTVFTFVPDRIIIKDTLKIILIIFVTFIIIAIFGIAWSLHYANRFTEPIKEITEAMEKFDGTDFSKKVDINTDTELDTIGQRYNDMLDFTEELIEKVTGNERRIWENELKMLMEQIHPHFLYNTLDNIYMMARINKDEQIMKMIRSLSQFLRISLSKGENIISLEEELTHAKSYMDILKIRNSDLFEYEINCSVDIKNTKIMKILLQPLIENAIKHGFVNMYDGGLIKITIAFEEDKYLTVKVFNNGEPMEREALIKINAMSSMETDKLYNIFESNERGYGVVNVISRLRLMYGDNISFYFEQLDDGVECNIKIPRSNCDEKFM